MVEERVIGLERFLGTPGFLLLIRVTQLAGLVGLSLLASPLTLECAFQVINVHIRHIYVVCIINTVRSWSMGC